MLRGLVVVVVAALARFPLSLPKTTPRIAAWHHGSFDIDTQKSAIV